jgi:hypothetical protein
VKSEKVALECCCLSGGIRGVCFIIRWGFFLSVMYFGGFFGSARAQTQSLAHARQTRYCCATSASVQVFLTFYFSSPLVAMCTLAISLASALSQSNNHSFF